MGEGEHREQNKISMEADAAEENQNLSIEFDALIAMLDTDNPSVTDNGLHQNTPQAKTEPYQDEENRTEPVYFGSNNMDFEYYSGNQQWMSNIPNFDLNYKEPADDELYPGFDFDPINGHIFPEAVLGEQLTANNTSSFYGVGDSSHSCVTETPDMHQFAQLTTPDQFGEIQIPNEIEQNMETKEAQGGGEEEEEEEDLYEEISDNSLISDYDDSSPLCLHSDQQNKGESSTDSSPLPSGRNSSTGGISSERDALLLLQKDQERRTSCSIINLDGEEGGDSDLSIIGNCNNSVNNNSIRSNVNVPNALPERSFYGQLYHPMLGHRFRAFDERMTYRLALQDLSQPKLEASPPEGVLSIPLLRHQKIALAWMVQKETRNLHCSGGILADDQGLGKTVSTISLILTERAPLSQSISSTGQPVKYEALTLDDDEDDDDGHASKKTSLSISPNPNPSPSPVPSPSPSPSSNINPAVKSGRPAAGTLVVCPTSVLRQWAEELRNKVSSKANLSFLVYHGTGRTRDPYELARYDVVLTTYAIVTMEVPKQPLADKDEEEKGKTDKFGVPPVPGLSSKKRKKNNNNKKNKDETDLNSALSELTVRPLARVNWFRVVLDEAQSIKNYRTQVARACWGLRAKRRWCLSGTPIQNAVDDLYSYFRFLRYEPYAVYKSFCSMIKVPISKNPTTGYKKLQAVLKTIMLRRTKGTQIDGKPIIILPPKTVNLKKVGFSLQERNFYSALEAASREQFREYAAAGTVKQNYVNILLMLLRLRQACNHPLLVNGYNSSMNWSSPVDLPLDKQQHLLSCLESSAICTICNDAPEDAVVTICGHVFCNQCVSERITGDESVCSACRSRLNFTSLFSKSTLKSSLNPNSNNNNNNNNNNSNSNSNEELFLPAEISPPAMSHSSKVKAALDILLSLPALESNSSTSRNESEGPDCKMRKSGVGGGKVKVTEKAIVFSQWTRMLDILEGPLKDSKLDYRRLDGTMSVAAREKAVKDFNTLPEVTVMIMSLKAASLGLNMVAACHVVLLDLWWNPTTEDQAIDRAHRIGQTRPVTVSRLTINDTVEDRILALQERKREMVSSAFGEDESGSRQTRLTVEDLEYLFMV